MFVIEQKQAFFHGSKAEGVIETNEKSVSCSNKTIWREALLPTRFRQRQQAFKMFKIQLLSKKKISH